MQPNQLGVLAPLVAKLRGFSYGNHSFLVVSELVSLTEDCAGDYSPGEWEIEGARFAPTL